MSTLEKIQSPKPWKWILQTSGMGPWKNQVGLFWRVWDGLPWRYVQTCCDLVRNSSWHVGWGLEWYVKRACHDISWDPMACQLACQDLLFSPQTWQWNNGCTCQISVIFWLQASGIFNGIDIMGLRLGCFRIMWFKRLRAYKCPGAMAWQGLSWSRGHSKF